MARNGYRVIDADLHCMEPHDLWLRYIEPAFRDRAPRGLELPTRFGLPYLEIGGVTLPDLNGGSRPTAGSPRASAFSTASFAAIMERQRRFAHFGERGWSSDCQIEAMDAEGLDVGVIFPTVGLYALGWEDLGDDLAAAVARAYNNWLFDFCRVHPDRLFGVAMVAPHDIEAAVREARRAVQDLGFRGVFLRPNLVRGRNWHDPYYEPLWSALEELGVPLGFHEGLGSLLPDAGARFGVEVGMRHVASHAIEMMLATISMCAGGVLERHPGLKVAFLEANCGWAPWLMERLDEHFELPVPGGRTPAKKLGRIIQEQCYFSVEADEKFVSQVVSFMGDDNIVFSTDFPHTTSKYPGCVDMFLESALSATSKRKILWDNPRKLYPLPREHAIELPAGDRSAGQG